MKVGYCSGCKETWKPKSWAHCTGCHKTFKSAGGFNKHRKKGKCLFPEDLGMVKQEGIWLTPMSEELKKRLGYTPKQGKIPTL